MGCAGSLFWAVEITAIILVLFALFFVQNVTSSLLDEDSGLDEVERGDILMGFGSVRHVILILIQCVTSGQDWGTYYSIEVLTGPLNSATFIFFIQVFIMAVWNIVTSLFIERTMQLALPDVENLILAKQRQQGARTTSTASLRVQRS